MNKKIFFITKIIIIYLFCYSINFAAESIVIPLKKPILDEDLKAQKISNNIIKPKSKPKNDIEKTKKITEGILKPKSKPKKTTKKEKPEVEIVKKEINFLTPKSKPLVVKKQKSKIAKKSEFKLGCSLNQRKHFSIPAFLV